MAKPNRAPENASHLAGRILVAWKLGPGPVLEQELGYAASAVSLDRRDTLEMEKMELLEGVAESLRNGRQGQIRAAMRILEHLAGTAASEVSR
ncbi:MAG TPA: hypothetical protein VMB25_15170 [Bryobacteraceae bacterium]|nr:hypothetical protein [Bryobacteraceae bacterium]